MQGIFDGILEALRKGDIEGLAKLTDRNWDALRVIIPAATNHFTETIIGRAREKFGADFRGFLMLGGMSGGGMANFVAPDRRDEFRDAILEIMLEAKHELEDVAPFAMDPVVYDFRINHLGSYARLIKGHKTSEIETLLGYRGRDEMIHRDDLVLND